MKKTITIYVLFLTVNSYCQETSYPIIDMHIHAYTQDARWNRHVPNPKTGKPLTADNSQKQYDSTLWQMKKWNYKKAMISGDTAAVARWKENQPELFIPGLLIDGINLPDTNWLKDAFITKKIQVLGEIEVQYDGIAPDSSIMKPYFALAERYDIPVAIHMGPAFPGAVYRGFPEYRVRLSNPLLLENVLARHPRLRIYVMHGGWPMQQEMLGLMFAYPNVYFELSGLIWQAPTTIIHDYLKPFISAGFGKRILFGSDQMVWPDAIPIAIETILSAGFLDEEQKKDIFYRNAERFLRIKL
jgi:predicted TIM-barrel fold metal-dependent hydrolase